MDLWPGTIRFETEYIDILVAYNTEIFQFVIVKY